MLRSTFGPGQWFTVALYCRVAFAITAQSLCALLPAALLHAEGAADARVTTILRGLDYQASLIRTIQGTAYRVGTYSATHQRRFPGGREVLPGRTFAGRDLQRLAFAVDWEHNRWDVQVVELVSAGFDPLATDGLFGIKPGLDAERPLWQRPQSRWVSDGQASRLYRYGTGRLLVHELQTEDARRGALHQLARHLGLTLGFQPSNLLHRICPHPRLGGNASVAGVACQQLICEAVPEAGPARALLSVAVNHGFALLKHDDMGVHRNNPREGYRWLVEAQEVRQFGDELWLPVVTVEHECEYREKEPESWRSSATFCFDSLRVNEPIDWQEVAARPLLGMTVYDTRDVPGQTVWGDLRRVLTAFESGDLTAPECPSDMAKPLTGDELRHLVDE